MYLNTGASKKSKSFPILEHINVLIIISDQANLYIFNKNL